MISFDIFGYMAADLKHEREMAIRDLFPNYPFPTYLGMKIDKLGYGTARLAMRFQNELTQGMGVIHGGAITSLCDTSAGVALCTMIDEGDKILTVELKINFISPADSDIFSEAKIIHKGQRTAVGEVDVIKSDGTLVAKALITYYVFRD
jgi:acyl-CoA thioesterase